MRKADPVEDWRLLASWRDYSIRPRPHHTTRVVQAVPPSRSVVRISGAIAGPILVVVLLIYRLSDGLWGEFASMATLIAPIAVFYLVFIAPRIHRRTANLLLALSCCSTAALLYTPITRWYTSNGGEHVTVEEAASRGLELPLPPQAEDITFDQHLRPDTVIRVEFTVSEDAFFAWADERGWDVGAGNTEAKSWLYTDVERGKPNTMRVRYNRQTGRVFYSFYSEPFYGE